LTPYSYTSTKGIPNDGPSLLSDTEVGTHCGFNDRHPDDCRNYPKCAICGSYDYSTLGYNRVILVRGGILAESSQSSKSLIGVSCNTCGSTMHSTTNHNNFKRFKRGEKIQATKAREPTKSGTHCGFNDRHPDDCRNYPECAIYGSYDHSTLGHNRIILVRGGILAESSQSSKSSVGDHLGKFDAKADDGYFIGYSFVFKAFKVFDTRRQKIKETYYVTFDESMEAIRFTNTSVDEIGIVDLTRYLPDDFLYEDDPSKQYQTNYDLSYYINPHNRSLTKLKKDTYIPEVVTSNEKNTPHTKDVEGPPDLINTEGTQEQEVQNEQINSQPTKEPPGNNTETLVPITEPSVPEVTQSQITHHASTTSDNAHIIYVSNRVIRTFPYTRKKKKRRIKEMLYKYEESRIKNQAQESFQE
nr:retrovirus-related Pol polyprotein from transposon TNT 1-94 [Tanacetum cinerariifolium]GEX65832.1 retrovirus-related Pol polyprotein from transposon TNT 1-94 [Tanacetum cinerariifolium]